MKESKRDRQKKPREAKGSLLKNFNWQESRKKVEPGRRVLTILVPRRFTAVQISARTVSLSSVLNLLIEEWTLVQRTDKPSIALADPGFPTGGANPEGGTNL